ncbi:MAG: radical SAM protein [Spirochaetales bacterium]|nr:radical SAM protein [Spirochaetales bacterium]
MKTVNRIVTDVVYGPVNSRRFGFSLGIDLTGPAKCCSFNCLYCFRGFNRISPAKGRHLFYDKDDIITAVERYFETGGMKAIDDITIAGNGEPTDNPVLPEIIRYLRDFRDRLLPGMRLTLLTNGMGMVPRLNPRHSALLESFSLLDTVCLKLDSAVPRTWKRLDRPAFGVDFDEWLDSVRAFHGPVIQTMLVRGIVDNTTGPEIESLVECYRILKPSAYHLLTLNKPPAHSGLVPVEDGIIREIKEKIRASCFINT